MEREIWADAHLPDFDFKYQVSSLGRVKRLAADIRYWNRGCYRNRHLPEKIIAQQKNYTGYYIVSLQRTTGGNDKLTIAVAPLVCRAFNGHPPSPNLHCAHLNGVRVDNRPENLSWVTPSENCSHKIRHGTAQRGEKHGNAKLTDSDIRNIRKTFAAGTRGIGRQLAAQFHISATHVTDICKRKSWKHVI